MMRNTFIYKWILILLTWTLLRYPLFKKMKGLILFQNKIVFSFWIHVPLSTVIHSSLCVQKTVRFTNHTEWVLILWMCVHGYMLMSHYWSCECVCMYTCSWIITDPVNVCAWIHAHVYVCFREETCLAWTQERGSSHHEHCQDSHCVHPLLCFFSRLSALARTFHVCSLEYVPLSYCLPVDGLHVHASWNCTYSVSSVRSMKCCDEIGLESQGNE